MHFVGRHRRIERVARAPVAHPIAIVPFIIERPRARCGERRRFGKECEWIGLVGFVAVLADDSEFIRSSMRNAGNECFPDSGAVGARVERIGAQIPAIEITNDRNAFGVRRPDAKPRAVLDEMAPHRVVEPNVSSLAKQVRIVVGERRPLPRLGCFAATRRL